MAALPVRRVAWPAKPGIEHPGFTNGRCIDAGIRKEINRGGVVELVAFIGQSADYLYEASAAYPLNIHPGGWHSAIWPSLQKFIQCVAGTIPPENLVMKA
ncbi:hypothetical protein ACLB1E_35015 [Escherichia coli]